MLRTALLSKAKKAHQFRGLYHWLAGTKTTNGSDNLGEGCALSAATPAAPAYRLAQLISIGGGGEDKDLHQWARTAKIVDNAVQCRSGTPVR